MNIFKSKDLELKSKDIKQIADDIAGQISLAIDKIALNYSVPDEFPLSSDNTSFEAILKPFFDRLSNDKKQAAYMQAKDRLITDYREKERRLSELAGINFRRAEPIEHLSKELDRPKYVQITPEDILNEQIQTFPPQKNE